MARKIFSGLFLVLAAVVALIDGESTSERVMSEGESVILAGNGKPCEITGGKGRA
jgi:hypothetical protein